MVKSDFIIHEIKKALTSNIQTYNVSIKGIISLLESENTSRHAIISDNPLFEILNHKRMDCLLFKGAIFEKDFREISKHFSKLQLDGHFLIDQQVDWPQEYYERLHELGFRLSLFKLID